MMLSLSASSLDAQTPCATIRNDSDCPVTVDIEIWKPTGVPGVCNFCTLLSGIAINSGMGFPVNCTGCGACDIVVTITDVGGNATTPANPSAGSTSNPTGSTFTSLAPCNAFKIDWNGLGTACKIQ